MADCVLALGFEKMERGSLMAKVRKRGREGGREGGRKGGREARE